MMQCISISTSVSCLEFPVERGRERDTGRQTDRQTDRYRLIERERER